MCVAAATERCRVGGAYSSALHLRQAGRQRTPAGKAWSPDAGVVPSGRGWWVHGEECAAGQSGGRVGQIVVVQVEKKVGCSHACKLQGPWLRGAGEAAVGLQRSAAVRLGQR